MRREVAGSSEPPPEEEEEEEEEEEDGDMSARGEPAFRRLEQLSAGFMASQVLFAACELGVFDTLAEAAGPLDAATVSAALGTCPRATELLLDACVGLELLRAQVRPGGAGGGVFYQNTELSSTYLVRVSPRSQRHMLLYTARTLYRCWAHLAEAVREGRSQHRRAFGVPEDRLFAAIYRSQDEQLRFMSGLQEVWRVAGRTVLSAFDLSGFPRICDLGGGSGALAQECVALYPDCHVTVFDMPEVVRMAEEHFSFREEGRIGFQEGDFFRDALPEADLFILARVLHDWADDKCSGLLRRVHRACKPGGGVLVVESLLDDDGRGPPATLLLSLNMLLQTEGRERTPAQYRALLGAAGFRDVQVQRTGGSYDALLARK